MKRVLMGLTMVGFLTASGAALADCGPTCEADCTSRRAVCVAACEQMYPDPADVAPGEILSAARRDTCEAACIDGETSCLDYCRECGESANP